MKTKLLIAMLLLLFAAPQGIGAQSIFVNRGEMGYAGVKVFEYPMQVLDYKGKKIEAFANIIYSYEETEEFTRSSCCACVSSRLMPKVSPPTCRIQ